MNIASNKLVLLLHVAKQEVSYRKRRGSESSDKIMK